MWHKWTGLSIDYPLVCGYFSIHPASRLFHSGWVSRKKSNLKQNQREKHIALKFQCITYMCTCTRITCMGTDILFLKSQPPRPLTRGVSGCLLDTLLMILDTLILVVCMYNAMGWKGIGHPIHFWTPNSEILAEALQPPGISVLSFTFTGLGMNFIA